MEVARTGATDPSASTGSVSRGLLAIEHLRFGLALERQHPRTRRIRRGRRLRGVSGPIMSEQQLEADFTQSQQLEADFTQSQQLEADFTQSQQLEADFTSPKPLR